MDNPIDESGSFLICSHGQWYRNGEQMPDTFASDRTLSIAELDRLEELKQMYFNELNQKR